MLGSMSDALLEPVGLGAAESALYLRVLSAPRATTAEDLERFRARARELGERFRSAETGAVSDLVELIEGPIAIRHRVEQMQLGAEQEMKVVDCPPYFDSPVANPIEFQLLRRGVACQVIYDASGLEGKRRMDFTMACIAAGEEARSLPSVRMKMLIADRREAMIPLSFAATEPTAAIFVRASPLLTALITCFDLLWERAAPIAVTGAAPDLLDQRDLELLTMLAGGVKDTAIIRALGITQRTMTRRVGHILAVLDARTRFQAGLQAARRST